MFFIGFFVLVLVVIGFVEVVGLFEWFCLVCGVELVGVAVGVVGFVVGFFFVFFREVFVLLGEEKLFLFLLVMFVVLVRGWVREVVFLLLGLLVVGVFLFVEIVGVVMVSRIRFVLIRIELVLFLREWML